MLQQQIRTLNVGDDDTWFLQTRKGSYLLDLALLTPASIQSLLPGQTLSVLATQAADTTYGVQLLVSSIEAPGPQSLSTSAAACGQLAVTIPQKVSVLFMIVDMSACAPGAGAATTLKVNDGCGRLRGGRGRAWRYEVGAEGRDHVCVWGGGGGGAHVFSLA